MSCLRAMGTNDIYSLYLKSGAAFIPVIDNYDLVQTPMEYLIEGNWNKVPTMLGTNQNELSPWICPKYSTLSPSAYEALVLGTLNKK